MSPTRGVPPLTENTDVGRGLRVAEGAVDAAGVPGVVAAHRTRDEKLVALCADPRWLGSRRLHCIQGASVPRPAQLPATRPPPHAAQPEFRCSLLGLRSLRLHGQLGHGLWGRGHGLRTRLSVPAALRSETQSLPPLTPRTWPS